MDYARVANHFAEQVVAGEVPACRYVRLACRRHLDDVLKSKADDFPYWFDADEVNRVVQFTHLLPHTKGEWAYQKKLIELEPWQVFGLGCTFGWRCKEGNYRRFVESYWEVPRKNGKSISAAAVGLLMFTDPVEFGSEVYSGATTEKQAWEVFRPAKIMVERTPLLQKASGIDVRAKKMIKPEDSSVFEPLIGNPGDGSSPSCALIDEYHEHDTSALYDTMRTGMGARRQPLRFIITTAGDNTAGPCYEKRQEIIDTLEGVILNDRLFGWIWTVDEGDDWTKPDVLKKANPNYGVSVYESYLIEQQRAAINSPRLQAAFKTKHLNIWVSARSAFFNAEKWKRCRDVFEESDFHGQECAMGADLAAKTDLNAKVKVYPRFIDGVRHYYVVGPKFWVPYDTIYANEDNRRLAEIYRSFQYDGFLTVVDGAEMDYRYILEECKTVANHSAVSAIGVDPHGATCLLHELDDEGLNPVVIQQNFTGMSDAMKELEAAILSGRIHHDGNPVLSWCISNVTGKYLQGSDDIVRPTKESGDKKIDGAVALIMAIGLAMTSEPRKKSIYNQTEL